ncbi:MAG: DUF2141 domain-containing protein [Akkermansiaceae bacterium]|nr:DUF2141 domain-containing protein [Akkermansiaceae bacterium]
MIKILMILAGLALPAAAGELVVKVQGVRNANGFVRGMVFKAADGFPEDHAKAVALAESKAKAGEVILRFKGVEEGQGAIIIIHDENDDKKLKRNIIGIPREGVGASNWRRNGRPKYRDAVVPVGPGKMVRVLLKYF